MQSTISPNWGRLPEELTTAQVDRMIDLFLKDTAAGDSAPEAHSFPPANGYRPGESLGSAVLVGNFVDGSPEWHAARRAGIGGSEIGSILGLNKWKSRYVLWLEKVGTLEAGSIDPKFAEWGHRLEPVLIQKFMDAHPKLKVVSGGSWVHKDRPWQKTNPDGLIILEGDTEPTEILECKTSQSGYGWGEESEGERGVPPKYLAQVRWYLNTFGFTKATIIVLIGLGDYREYTVHADPFETMYMLEAGKEFMSLVTSQTPPAIDGGEDTYNYLRGINPSIDTKLSVELPEEIAVMVSEAKAAYEAADIELIRAKGHLLAHMGVAKTATFAGKPVSVREARGGNPPFIKLK